MTTMSAPAVVAAIADDVGDQVEAVAGALVATGRVVPGLTVAPDGRARSWWFPLPAAGDRERVASCCTDGSVVAQFESGDAGWKSSG